MTLNDTEIKALISLLDDTDQEVSEHIEHQIRQLGGPLIPHLESEWESSSSPLLQKKIEELIHDLQYEQVLNRLQTWKLNGGTDLLEGLWAVATYQYPDLSLEKLRNDIEQFYFDTWLEVRGDMHPVDQVKNLNNVFFSKLKFAANTKHFHSPANSMLNQVLESRRGNPISLCVIYMLIAQKIGLPIYGVNLPNLFVLTYKQPGGVQFYINVFSKGLVFSKKDIDQYIGQLNLKPADRFYQPCSNVAIVSRMLRNLSMAFGKKSDTDRVTEVEQLLAAVRDEEDSMPLSDYSSR